MAAGDFRDEAHLRELLQEAQELVDKTLSACPASDVGDEALTNSSRSNPERRNTPSARLHVRRIKRWMEVSQHRASLDDVSLAALVLHAQQLDEHPERSLGGVVL